MKSSKFKHKRTNSELLDIVEQLLKSTQLNMSIQYEVLSEFNSFDSMMMVITMRGKEVKIFFHLTFETFTFHL
jgi:hypothetical protein